MNISSQIFVLEETKQGKTPPSVFLGPKVGWEVVKKNRKFPQPHTSLPLILRQLP